MAPARLCRTTACLTAAASLLLLVSSHASAATLPPQVLAFGPTLAGGPDIPLSFTQFDPATAGGTGGTLNSVKIDYAFSGSGGTFTWELLAGGGSFDVDFGVSVEIKPDTSAPIVPLGTVSPNPDSFTENSMASFPIPLGPFVVPYAAAAGSGTGTEAADPAFQGVGTFDILVDITDVFIENLPTVNATLSHTPDTVIGSVTVTYDYTPTTTAIPEPSTFLILGIGALLVLPTRRRRQRS